MSLFHLIAPSGYCIKQHAALRGIQRLTDAGHQVNNVEVIARRCERFAGTETERLEDLNSLARLTTPNTIVLAVRGGYGASRFPGILDKMERNGAFVHYRAGCTRWLRCQSFTGGY